MPSAELTRLAGCQHTYAPYQGGWVPTRDEDKQTSVEGVFAVGDGAGVAGSSTAMCEGRIAGISVAQSLDHISFPRAGLFELATDDTIICRCEELTLGDVKRAIGEGSIEMNELKRMTRMGMGRCQGRMCAPAVQEIIARQTQTPAAEIEYLVQRPPVKLVPIEVLASLPGEFEIRHGW